MKLNRSIRIAMLHVAPIYDNVQHNLTLLEQTFCASLAFEPDLVLTPELAISGYEFNKAIGTSWIKDFLPHAVSSFSRLASENSTAIVFGSPRFNEATNSYHNAAIFIDERGEVAGEHHKINVLPGSEGWSSSGEVIRPVPWRGHKIGLLICSDAFTEDISETLAKEGADVLISPAAWAPGMHEPDGEWEGRNRETSLPLYVCNRTGKENKMNFEGSASVAVADGRRLAEYSDKRQAILTIDADGTDWHPIQDRFTVLAI